MTQNVLVSKKKTEDLFVRNKSILLVLYKRPVVVGVVGRAKRPGHETNKLLTTLKYPHTINPFRRGIQPQHFTYKGSSEFIFGNFGLESLNFKNNLFSLQPYSYKHGCSH